MTPTATSLRSRFAAGLPARGHPILIGSVALVVALLGFGWTLGGYFLGDDFGYVGRFFEYPLLQWPRLFVETWAGDIWGFQLREVRPITALSFMIDARLWGGHAWGFRSTNLLLHVACATMVGWIAWRASERDLFAGLAAATLFALHSVHAEPVQWITGRVDVLATTWYLAGFLVFLRYRERGDPRALAALPLLYAGAAFSKEFGLTLPVMFLFADAMWQGRKDFWRERKAWGPYWVCASVVVPYYFCRRAALGAGGVGAGLPGYTDADILTQIAHRQLVYLSQLFPWKERWLNHAAPLPIAEPLRHFGLIGGCIVLALAAWYYLGRHRSIAERRATIFFGLGWYLVATLPLVVTYISPRHLYLASAGVCIALALLLRGMLRHPAVFTLVVIAICAGYAQRLSVTMRPWHQAAVVSGIISDEVRKLEPHIRPGAALLLDVPEIKDGAYVWTWAVPFALRPPFTRGRLDTQAVVFESRGLYVNWYLWHTQPAVEALGRVDSESWILQMIDNKPLRRIRIDLAKLPAAVKHFVAADPKEKPHESWRALINELTAP